MVAELSFGERNLLSAAHKNALGGRRAAWDVTSAEQNRAEEYLEMSTEIAEKNDDHEKFYEQFGECSNPGNRKDSTIRARIAELLRVSASMSEDDQLSLKECVDRMDVDPNDMYSIIGESIAAVSSFIVLDILRKKSLEEESAAKVQKTVDVPVVWPGQVPTVQAVQKTVEVPQVQFNHPVVDVSVAVQRHLPQERIQELIAESTGTRAELHRRAHR